MIKKIILILAVLVFCASAASAGWLSGETQRLRLRLDHTKAGASDLTNFPVTVFLTSARWNFDLCDFSGLNIRVTSSDGTTLLKYDRDYYDSINSVGVIHVKVPTYSASTDTIIYIYSHWSLSSDAVDGEDVANTWVNYTGVYHLSYPLHSASAEWNSYKEADAMIEGQAGDNYIISEPSYWYDETDNLWKLWLRSKGGVDAPGVKYLWSSTPTGFNWTDATSILMTGYQQPTVFINDVWHTPMEYALLDDGGSFTDDTTDANDVGTDDMALLPATPAVNDAIYFGGKNKSNYLVLNIGTAGAGTWVLTWEYYDGDSWEALAGVVDGTSGFTISGTHNVTYNLPADWEEVAIDSKTSYYIRARVSSYTTIATQPIATQSWIHQKFWLYMAKTITGCTRCQEDLWTSANETDFILDSADILNLYSTNTQFGNFGIWQEGSDGFAIGDQLSSTWDDYLYTTTDGRIWTDPTPISAPISSWGDVQIIKIGSYYYGFGHGGDGTAGIPSDIYLYRSTDKITWTAFGVWGNTTSFSGKVISRSLSWECSASAESQVADVWLLDGPDGNLYISYDAYCNQGPFSSLNTIKEGIAIVPYSFQDYIETMYQVENKIDTTWTTSNSGCSKGTKVGSSAAFDSTDMITIGDHFDPGTGDWTCEFLMTAANQNTYQVILDKRLDTPTTQWPFYIRVIENDAASNARKLEYYTRDATEIDALVSGQVVGDATWHYVACIRDADAGKRLIIDGNAATSNTTQQGDTLNNSMSATISSSTSTVKLNGGVDEVRFSSVVRSDDWCHATKESLSDSIITYGGDTSGIIHKPLFY